MQKVIENSITYKGNTAQLMKLFLEIQIKLVLPKWKRIYKYLQYNNQTYHILMKWVNLKKNVIILVFYRVL